MKGNLKPSILAFCGGLFWLHSASAQMPDYDAIAVGLSHGRQCDSVVTSAIHQIEEFALTSSQADTQLGLLAGAILEEAYPPSQASCNCVPDALRMIAAASSTQQQADEIIAAADEVANCTARIGPRGPFGNSDG